MSKKSRYPELKQEIRDREKASREIRKRIRAASGMDRWEAWQDKRGEGKTTRCLLLIYAMLRGVPRHVGEAKHDVNDNWWILNGMHRMAEQREYALTKDAIEAWLTAKAPTVAKAEVAA